MSERPSLVLTLIPVWCALLAATVASDARAQKTDVITFRNGDDATGEIIGLQSGKLEFKTYAMGTADVEWPKVATVRTTKRYQIVLDEGTLYFGSIEPARGDSVVIRAEGGLIGVPTHAIVRLERQKPNFWSSLDGQFSFGLDFTEQNAKTDFNLGADVRYNRKANRTDLRTTYAVSRQDGTDDIVRIDGVADHLRRLKHHWFYLGILSFSRNSQLNLDSRITVGTGVGRYLVESNRVDLNVWAGPAISRERFAGDVGPAAIPLVASADFTLFIWEDLDTDVSSQFAVMPVINQSGRWRLEFNLDVEREIIQDVAISLGINQAYDSEPPSADANNNDFSITTGIVWKF